MNKLRNILLLINVLFSSALLITGCTGDESSAFSNIPTEGWVYGDTIYFTPGQNAVKHNETDTVKEVTGNLSIIVRHNNYYEYSNLWLEFKYQGSDSIVTDTVNIKLADDFGNWLGKGIGISFQREQKVLDNVTISCETPIKVSHIMRVDTLPEIEQVGLLFVPSQTK